MTDAGEVHTGKNLLSIWILYSGAKAQFAKSLNGTSKLVP
jgi:hypothetical protein